MNALSLDLAQRLRTLAIDAKPRSGFAGTIGAFSTPLLNIAGGGAGELDASTIVAIPDGWLPEDLPAADAAHLLEALATDGELNARIVVDADGARLEGKASLAPGHYTLYARREGQLHQTMRTLTVDDNRQALFG